MNDLAQILTSVRHFLESIHPAAPWAALALIPWAVNYLIRRYFPRAWVMLESITPPNSPNAARVMQALPGVLFTSALAALGDGSDPVVGIKAAIVSALAPVIHHALKASPLPYLGAVSDVGDDDDDDTPTMPSGVFVSWSAPLLFAMSVSACGFGGGAARPPKFNAGEALCLLGSETQKMQDLEKCGAVVEGECSSREIVDRKKERDHACLRAY